MPHIVHDQDVLRVTARLKHALQDQQNVYHLRWFGSDTDPFDLADDIADWLDAAYSEFQPEVPMGTTYYDIEVWNVTQDEPIAVLDWPTLTVGGASSNPFPLQTAPLVLFNTTTARSQGRKYLPSLTEGASAGDGILSAGVIAMIADFAVAILSDVIGTGGYASAGNWNEVLERFAVWASGAISYYLRTQRRRVQGVGV
jgi:hypothetical protein